MTRENYLQDLEKLIHGRPIQNEVVQGDYLGEYIDSARQNLTRLDDVREFAAAAAMIFSKYGLPIKEFNQDQKFRFVQWMRSFEIPMAQLALYSFYKFEMRELENESKEWKRYQQITEVFEVSLKQVKDIYEIICIIKVLPEWIDVFEPQLEEYLKGADAFGDGSVIASIVRAVPKCKSKLLCVLGNMQNENLTKSKNGYQNIRKLYGERGLNYLNLYLRKQTGYINSRGFGILCINFVHGLLDGSRAMNLQEKELLEDVYTIPFCNQIESAENLSKYLYKKAEWSWDALSDDDWKVFYCLERTIGADICSPPLYFKTSRSEITKWKWLSSEEKDTLLVNDLKKELSTSANTSAEIFDWYEKFYAEMESQSLKEMLSLRYANLEEAKEVVSLLIDRGVWELPAVQVIMTMGTDNIPLWLKEYTDYPESMKAGHWVLDWYKVCGAAPEWFVINSTHSLKKPWLLNAEESFRYEYFYMYIDTLICRVPEDFQYRVSEMIFGGTYWSSSSDKKLNMEFYLSAEDLRIFYQFLQEEVGLKDRDDIIKKYLMGEEAYKQEKEEKEHMQRLQQFINLARESMRTFVNSDCKLSEMSPSFSYLKIHYGDIIDKFKDELLPKAAELSTMSEIPDSESIYKYINRMVKIASESTDEKGLEFLAMMSKRILNTVMQEEFVC